jgi:hypothetical protein
MYSDELRAEWAGFDSQQHNNFLFPTASSPTWGPTQPHIQWIPAALSLGVKWLDVKLTTDLHIMARSKKLELYLHSPICLHGIVLN